MMSGDHYFGTQYGDKNQRWKGTEGRKWSWKAAEKTGSEWQKRLLKRSPKGPRNKAKRGGQDGNQSKMIKPNPGNDSIINSKKKIREGTNSESKIMNSEMLSLKQQKYPSGNIQKAAGDIGF